MLKATFGVPVQQNGYLLDTYTFGGKTYDWMQFHYLRERYIHGDSHSMQDVSAINLAKWTQEKERAEELIDNEKDSRRKDQMMMQYFNQNFALDNIFFGKEIHRPLL